MRSDLIVALLRVLKHAENGGFCRDSTTAQCPTCGKYAEKERDRVIHEFGCKMEYVIAEVERELP